MEKLNRKPKLDIKTEFDLKDGTKIAIRQVKASVLVNAAKAKNMTDQERGLHIIASKLLVNGQPIVYDDLIECFNDEELTLIATKIAELGEGDEKND